MLERTLSLIGSQDSGEFLMSAPECKHLLQRYCPRKGTSGTPCPCVAPSGLGFPFVLKPRSVPPSVTHSK